MPNPYAFIRQAHGGLRTQAVKATSTKNEYPHEYQGFASFCDSVQEPAKAQKADSKFREVNLVGFGPRVM